MASQLKILAQNCLRQAGGDFITVGTFSVVGTDVLGKPIPVSDSAGNQFTATPSIRQINNGSIIGSDLNIPNPATSSPRNYRVQIRIVDQSGQVYTTTIYPNCPASDSGDGTWNFASMRTGAGNPDALVIPGDQGLSAYQIAVSNGYVGTQAEWIASLKGDPGDISWANIAKLQTALLPASRNVLDNTRLAANVALTTTGATESAKGYYVTPYCYIGDVPQIVASFNIASPSPAYPNCWFYDVNYKAISAGVAGGTTTNAGMAINVPVGAVFVRVYALDQILVHPATPMLMTGSTVPSNYVAYQLLDTAMFTRTLLSYLDAAKMGTALDAILPSVRNIFDPARSQDGYINASGGNVDPSEGATSPYKRSDYCYLSNATQIIWNVALQGSIPGNAMFYDINKTFISASIAPGATLDPETPVSVPVNARYVRFWWLDGYYPDPTIIILVLGATLPDAAVLPFQPSTLYDKALYPFINKRMVAFGDSITARGTWTTQCFQKYHRMKWVEGNLYGYNSGSNKGEYASRTKYVIGDIVWYETKYYRSLVVSNTGNQPDISVKQWEDMASTFQNWGWSGITTMQALKWFQDYVTANPTGPTLAQQLQNVVASADVISLFYGTNDTNTPIGAITDIPAYDASTKYAAFRFLVESFLTAIAATGKQILLFGITPYRQTKTSGVDLENTTKVIEDVCELYGIPVINNLRTLGINSYNWKTTLLYNENGDGQNIHPSALGFEMLANNVARRMTQMAQRWM